MIYLQLVQIGNLIIFCKFFVIKDMIYFKILEHIRENKENSGKYLRNYFPQSFYYFRNFEIVFVILKLFS